MIRGRRRSILLRALLLSLALVYGVGAHPSHEASNPMTAAGLPEGPNRELVFALCSGCHSLKLVTQTRLDRQRWDRTLVWMEQRHNLRFPSPELREKILSYLSQYLSPQPAHGDGLNPSLPRLVLNPLPQV